MMSIKDEKFCRHLTWIYNIYTHTSSSSLSLSHCNIFCCIEFYYLAQFKCHINRNILLVPCTEIYIDIFFILEILVAHTFERQVHRNIQFFGNANIIHINISFTSETRTQTSITYNPSEYALICISKIQGCHHSVNTNIF